MRRKRQAVMRQRKTRRRRRRRRRQWDTPVCANLLLATPYAFIGFGGDACRQTTYGV